jgi:uncharacterized protein (TIGR01777 family)
VHLSRKSGLGKQGVRNFAWNPDAGTIDQAAFEDAQYLIHLAGENVGKGRWTATRKKAILESRVNGTRLISETLKRMKHNVRVAVCASAIGFYGSEVGHESLNEEAPAGTDFLANVCVDWEQEEHAFAEQGIRTVILRTGLVLAKEGGPLPMLALPARLGFGAPLGSGKQAFSWIHIDDLCSMYIESLTEKSWNGVYNAVAPHPVTNELLMQEISKQFHRAAFPIHVPGFAIRAAMGEMGEQVLKGQNVSSAKIETAGFRFIHPMLAESLQDLLGKKNG